MLFFHRNGRVSSSQPPPRRRPPHPPKTSSNPTYACCLVSIPFSILHGVDGRHAPKLAPQHVTGKPKVWHQFKTIDSKMVNLCEIGRAAFKWSVATLCFTKKPTATRREPTAKNGTAADHGTPKMTTVSPHLVA